MYDYVNMFLCFFLPLFCFVGYIMYIIYLFNMYIIYFKTLQNIYNTYVSRTWGVHTADVACEARFGQEEV